MLIIVKENLVNNFSDEIEIPEVRCFYGFQIAIENIHSSLFNFIDKFISDINEKNRLFNAIETIPCIKEKANWSLKWLQRNNSSFAERLVAFAVVEGIFFSGSFVLFLVEKRFNVSLTFSNELISRDEGMYTDFAVLIYSHLVNKLSEETN